VEIRVENLDYVYDPGTPLEIRALSGVSFQLSGGSILGILGGTGSGKTTLIRNLNGLLMPTRGRILLDGADTASAGPELRRKVGVVFQRPERQLFASTVFEDITFVLHRFSLLSEDRIGRKAEQSAQVVGLNLDEMSHRSPLALSDGEKRKVAMAGVLVNEPETLILDEPAVGLDPHSTAELVRVIERMKGFGDRTVVIVSHDMEPFLDLLDALAVLDQGKLAAYGSPEEVCGILGNDERMRELLPGPALLSHDLASAGVPISPGEFSVPVLVERLTRLLAPNGDVH
jgi:energy-coupling factor transport system ATP-binding protein